MRIVINRQWCKRCGLCSHFCPKNLLSIENNQVVMSDSSKCNGCLRCSYYCPDFSLHEECGELDIGEEYL